MRTLMASVFGHIAASSALGAAFFPKQSGKLHLALAGMCAAIPDLDVLAFRYGIPYESQWGHRGWTHSLVFALVFGVLVAALASLNTRSRAHFWQLSMWFVLATASHPLLDMLTNGGRGVALWWPFSLERIFFPLRPILVSPLGAGAFFSPWGLRVIMSELFWIGGPCVLLVLVSRMFRLVRNS